MSIGVAVSIPAGVVLSADRQLTDANTGLKFQQQKLFWKTSLSDEPFYNLIFTYVGHPEAGKNVYELAWVAVEKAVQSGTDIRKALERAFKSRETKHVQTLIGVQTTFCSLFKTSGSRVSTTGRDFIGSGDSSVLRYFSDIISPTIYLMPDATALAIYLASLANRFVQGCGFGVDAAIIEKGHPLRILAKSETSKYAERFAKFERQMEKEFFRVA